MGSGGSKGYRDSTKPAKRFMTHLVISLTNGKELKFSEPGAGSENLRNLYYSLSGASASVRFARKTKPRSHDEMSINLNHVVTLDYIVEEIVEH